LQDGTLKWERNSSAGPNVKLFGCAFLLGDQFMSMLGMPKHVSSDRLKPAGRTIALNPSQHFAQVDHFVFNDSLHSRQSIMAFMTTHADRIAWLSERLEQQGCGQRDLIVRTTRLGSGPSENGSRGLASSPCHPGTESKR
jgi:hypothetical protein